jgi:hypothetical protein
LPQSAESAIYDVQLKQEKNKTKKRGNVLKGECNILNDDKSCCIVSIVDDEPSFFRIASEKICMVVAVNGLRKPRERGWSVGQSLTKARFSSARKKGNENVQPSLLFFYRWPFFARIPHSSAPSRGRAVELDGSRCCSLKLNKPDSAGREISRKFYFCPICKLDRTTIVTDTIALLSRKLPYRVCTYMCVFQQQWGF